MALFVVHNILDASPHGVGVVLPEVGICSLYFVLAGLVPLAFL